jgi:molybdate transport system permease protein
VIAPTNSSLRVLCALLATVAAGLFALPLLGLLASAPWARMPELLASGPVHEALRLSLVSSLGAVVLALVLGLPLALWLAAGTGALRTAVRTIVTLPVVLPPIVAGIALLLAFGRRGLLGAQLDLWFGWSLPFSTAATVIAAAYMGLPFFVLAAEAGLRALDPRYEAAAATLGAGPWRRLWTVTLPMVQPALRTGALLCWARALGEFCATQMFAGNLQGTTRTLPLACAVAMETDPALATGLSLILAALSLAVLSVLRHGWVPQR